ncbi:hypothetical protein PALU110988_20780 [Paenibacillus lupini]|nr:hypothetical protein [Paenibacillus lupini]
MKPLSSSFLLVEGNLGFIYFDFHVTGFMKRVSENGGELQKESP